MYNINNHYEFLIYAFCVRIKYDVGAIINHYNRYSAKKEINYRKILSLCVNGDCVRYTGIIRSFNLHNIV